MGVVVGPILERPNGYAFYTWTVENGVNRGYLYRRVEEASHARKVTVDRAAAKYAPMGCNIRTCGTLEEFMAELVERGLLVTDSVLHALYSWHNA
jgi:hypothetical protein